MRHVTPLCALLLGACMTSHPPRPSGTGAAAPASSATIDVATPTPTTDDPHLWLEEIEGERAVQWVRARNARSLGTLQSDPRYAQLHADALRIVEATDRIAMPDIRGRTIYNFWQDPTHVRGILRRTTFASYRSASTGWEVVLDLDDLSARENANFVYHGTTCLRPEERRCLVGLSNGGKDADELREFDLETKRFVDGGFRLAESKGHAAWLDENTLLAWRDFGPGTLTKSGYPFVVKRVKRGQPIEQAVEVFRGAPDDVSANASVIRDADGRLQAVLVSRNVTFWENDFLLLRDDGPPVPLPFPRRNSIRGLVDGQLVFTTESAWNGFEAGDLLAYDLAALKADPASAKPQLVLRPGPREAIEDVTVTRNTLVVNLSENVKGAAYVYRHGASGWTRTRLPLPESATIGLGSASKATDELFVTVSSYLVPVSLWLADAAAGTAEKVTSMPERFDASRLQTTQYEATSADGTKVPYFVVGPWGMPRDGSNPTVLYGYGGYQVSLLPGYSGTIGKLWLERGGVYVVANTRGGGEFGPAWHQAAQGANRHRAHEDFVAVAQDLVARRITSPRRLGIMGGSQGGLFMGVAMTQRPELFNAAVIQVPLFDMMRFHKLLAGASWIAEYGDPDVPEQRAWIAKYSPYQALKPGQKYPEPFIHTSTKDDRVHPGHARKAVARLEELGYPVLFYENIDGGHSAAANLKETAKRIALEWTYLTRKLMDEQRLTP
jgi:prolyl oligopeptidase